MHISILPATRLGVWSMWLSIACLVFFILFQVLIAIGEQPGDTIFDNLKLSITGLMFAVCGISAFFTGIISLVINKERSFLAFISTAIGFFSLLSALLVLLGE